MKVREILEKLYEEGSFEGGHSDIHPDRITEALSELRAMVDNVIEDCLVANDSDTHILAEDLRKDIAELFKGGE